MPGTRTPRPSENRRAAIYARVSDKSQAEDDKTSLAEQIGDMEAYCAERGYTITARYQEVGRGWSKQRPEFQRMLADARDGRFDTVVCWKSDRLSRGMYPAAALMEVVEAQRIGIEAVMDAIDMKTFGLMAAIGKIEPRQLPRARLDGQARGRQAGPHPRQLRSLRLPHHRGRRARRRRGARRGGAAYLPAVRRRGHGRARDRPATHERGRPHGRARLALARAAGQPHPPQRDLPGHLVVRQGPPHRHRRRARASTSSPARAGSACPSPRSWTTRSGSRRRRCGSGGGSAPLAIRRCSTCSSTSSAAASAAC